MIELLRAQVSQGSNCTNTILMPNIEMHDSFWDRLLQVYARLINKHMQSVTFCNYIVYFCEVHGMFR